MLDQRSHQAHVSSRLAEHGVADRVIECRGVWKVFGPRAEESLRVIQNEGLSQAEALKRLDCVVAVAGVDLEIVRGEIFCIMGLSGSGKSTLVRHINRLIEPTAGCIIVDGEDISSKNAADMRRLRSEKLGMVFQNMALLPHRTVRDNIAFGLELRGVPKEQRLGIAEEKLCLVRLQGFGDRFPDQLSGGMQQRVGLARAMAADPDILLMDEPFSALDPLIRRQLQDQFLELASRMRKTTVFITHDLDEAIRLGDRIAIMREGRVVQIGTPSEIVRNPKDTYVADFVKGISRLKLVAAGEIMEPIESHVGLEGVDTRLCPRAHIDDDLNALVDLAADTDLPIIVAANGRDVGLVTKRRLLRGIQGKQLT
jgi:glycine betaine/proline transport system ATP-binding protein